MIAPNCQRCGAPLDSAADDALCAACLLHCALDAQDDGMPLPATQRLPRDFGSYRLIEEIGRGGMGVVYRAEHVGLKRVLAIKLLLAGAHASEVALLRFQREAAAVAALQHPNIIAIHDYGEIDGQPFYTMDLVDGRDLAARCGGRPLPARHAAEMLRILADAVHHAHTRGVIHRDLKPSNVLVDETGRPRLADFGLAKLMGATTDATVTGQMLGSPNYVSPEQAGATSVDNGIASDVYGLGALLYHVLTGRAPFNAATSVETLRLVLETEPTPPHLLTPGLPRDLETICLKCLAKDPAQRYASAGAVADELGRFLADKPILARPPGWIEHAAKFCRRHRVGVASTVAVLAVLVAVLTTVFSTLIRERAALARALRAEQGQTAARSQAGEFAAFMIGDLGLTMKRYGNSGMLLRIAEQTDAYYRQLPPELLDRASRIRHAAALEQLGSLRVNCRGDTDRGIPAMREAVALREAILREDPDDGEAGALLVWTEWQLAWMSGDRVRTWDPAWREGLIRRLRDIRARRPDCHPAVGCLAWLLCCNGSILRRDPARVREGLAQIVEGNAIIDTFTAIGGASLDDENHFYGTMQGCRTMLAGAWSAAGEHARAVEIQEACLAQFSAAWQSDTGHLMLRELVARTALQLCPLARHTSVERMREAELLARGHFQALIGLDPENLHYRYGFVDAHSYSPECLLRQANWREARAALVAWDHACTLMQDRAQAWTPDFRHMELPLWIAEVSARLGDVAEAQRWIAEVPPRIDLQIRTQPELDEALERGRAAQSAAFVAFLAPDWPDAGRLVDDAGAQIESLHAARPGDAELTQRMAVMRGLQGILLARQGRTDEAAKLIGESVSAFPTQPASVPRLNLPAVQRVIMDAWCQVLARMERHAEAVSAAEAMCAAQEAECTRDPQNAAAQELLAADLVRLADMLALTAPNETSRVREMLDRATMLVDSAEARGAWQTVEDHRIGNRLKELRETTLRP